MLQKMAQRGTHNKSKTEFAEEIENMGARYSAHSDREFTSYGIHSFKGDATRAVGILGDLISNITLNPSELELVKDEVSMEHESNHQRYEETLLENVHFNSYREHMLGQPIKGDRDLTSTIGVDNLREFHTANYIGDKIVIVATGDVNHDEIVDHVEQHFN